MSEEVYFIDAKANAATNTSVPAKAQWLFENAHFDQVFTKGDNVAIKIHVGEWFNTGYLRPNIIRAIVEKVKEYGGKPFVTDTTTLLLSPYWGRTTALDALYTAAANGFTESTMKCPVVIADGDVGLNDVHVDLPEGILLQETFVASAIANADAVICLSHFKGHDIGVYGGSIKNVGVGCVSKRGKMMLHLTSHPKYGIVTWPFTPDSLKGINHDEATSIEGCCPVNALHITSEGLEYEKEKCIGCGFVHVTGTSDFGTFSIPDEWRKLSVICMADSAAGVMKVVGKKKMAFMNFAYDITPFCDCCPGNDRPIMPNLGVFASKSITGIDLACLDMSMETEGLARSMAEDEGALEKGTEKFTLIHASKGSQWIQVNVAAHLGLGTKDYKLLKIEPGPKEKACFPGTSYPDRTVSYRFRKYYEHSPIPPGGFKWRDIPSISLEELSKR
jgi:uncharacterized Fe-S center protein